ncbi:Glycerophosphodiester phosphodiesterase protein kinase domain-containing GDPDL2 [Capsicum baccatum]|uniref:Glycerophosphodiester phosphodiesterase protein kinase domain-containing GDPDL2 n=1 Tax=Capsicum baccatum TaxID=33114 RepID=A0A2G2V4Q7_CAPBA|nr:Glycerophosphodiester phosphodiesterase protein kinase domain-containing GDPDL2 [Capsicum baccatum]
MSKGAILLKCSTLVLIIVFLHIPHTCNARKSKHYYCPPSTCGHIRNISFPFSLNTDPTHCGDDPPIFELACEGNQTFIWLSSNKLYVQAINYDNQTLRLVDQTLQTQDVCSLRGHAGTFGLSFPYHLDPKRTAEPIFIFNCPLAVNNSSRFLEIGGCNSSRYTYLKMGEMNASEVSDGCEAEFIGMTSWPNIKDHVHNNISLSDFHQAILYGFELYYYRNLRFGGRIRYLEAKFVIGLPFIIAFLVIKFRRRHLSMYDTIEGFLQTQNNFMPIRYNYYNIKRMTRGFKEKLGEGGYGSVYKGKLRSGRNVAVKMLSKPKAGGQDFMNEVATIGRIHHVNVVGLVGYCVERTKRSLVYDFMPNGSLDKYISSSQEQSPVLSWQRKYDIVLGVARGIEYLHRGCDVRILHFDIKPHNVLLDENFIPKISDFGLAKLYPTDNSIVRLTAARGTIGYVAPELISRSIGAISYKADVYSFGMLLMEMLDLKRNVVETEEKSSQYFPCWVYDKFNKGKEIVVDEEANDDEKEMARKMTLVALWCIQTNPVQRPSMSKVVEMLEGEVQVLEVPPQPIQSKPIGPLFHQIMESSMTFSSDSIALLENSANNPVELDICSD